MKKTLYTLLAAMLIVDMAEGMKIESQRLRAEAKCMGISLTAPLPPRRNVSATAGKNIPLTMRRHHKITENGDEGLLPGQSPLKKVRYMAADDIKLPQILVVPSSPELSDETMSSLSSSPELSDEMVSSLSSSPKLGEDDVSLTPSDSEDVQAREYLDLSRRTLDLSNCSIDVRELIDTLEYGVNGEFERGTLSSLHVLNFSGSDIDAIGVNALLTSIFGGRTGGKRFSVMASIFAPQAQIQWRELNFSGCNNIGKEGARQLAWGLKHNFFPDLEKLDLSGCSLSDKSIQELHDAVEEAATASRQGWIEFNY